MRPRVLVISLGGTIAMERDSSRAAGAIPSLDADALASGVPELQKVAEVETLSLGNLPSAHLELNIVPALMAELEQRYKEVDGFVVTTGTDTLEEVAFGLDLLWNRQVPVVVTGAMRNASLPGADGPANLLASVQTAGSRRARGLGCLVVLNDEIHAARFVTKAHSTLPSAFVSTGLGPLGWVVEGSPIFLLRPCRRRTIEVERSASLANIALIKMTMGAGEGLFADLASAPWGGVVVEALGGGHVPPSVADAIERLIAGGIPVVLSSRAGGGATLSNSYAFVGSESDLLARGAWSAGVLGGVKSRVLLSIVLASADRDMAVSAKEFASIASPWLDDEPLQAQTV